MKHACVVILVLLLLEPRLHSTNGEDVSFLASEVSKQQDLKSGSSLGRIEQSSKALRTRGVNYIEEHPVYLRQVLQSEAKPGCTLSKALKRRIYNEDSNAWIIDQEVLNNVDNNIQSVINCSSENDIILFQIKKAIKLTGTLSIPWSLTMNTLPEGAPIDNGKIVESTSKTHFICPESGDLLHAKGSSFVFANIIFSGCQKSGNVVFLDHECSNSEIRAKSHFAHIEFRYHEVSVEHRIVNISTPSCSDLELENVILHRNSCHGSECLSLASKNILKDIKMTKNQGRSASFHHAVFSCSHSSQTIARNITGMRNKLRIFNLVNSSLDLSNSYFAQNFISSSYLDIKTIFDGGILFSNYSKIYISESAFKENHASNGGAIYLSDRSQINITESLFENNLGQAGGAVYLTNHSNATILNSTFFENAANYGGGVLTSRMNSTASIWYSNFTKNKAHDRGGAISIARDCVLWIYACNFTSNEALNGGSVKITHSSNASISNSHFENDTALAHGGSIDILNASKLTVLNSSFVDNKADRGGAIHARINVSLMLSRTSCIGAITEFGGCLRLENFCEAIFEKCSFSGNKVEKHGGAVELSHTSKLVIISSKFLDNQAKVNAGAVHVVFSSTLETENCRFGNNSGTTFGGALRVWSSSTLIDLKSVFNGNKVERHGGAISIDKHCSVSLFQSRLVNNTALYGGGIHIHRSKLQAVKTEFYSCEAWLYGGGVYANMASVTLNQSKAIRNVAIDGGALHVRHISGAFSNTSFKGNLAYQNGGALHCSQSNLTLQRSKFTTNEAVKDGGGIYASEGAYINGTDLALLSNLANAAGGGIAIGNSSSILCQSCNFQDNKAFHGAGLYAQSNNSIPIIAQLQSCDFENNSAISYGGGLEFYGSQDKIRKCSDPGLVCGSIVLLDTKFVKNKAQHAGSAIITSDPRAILVSCNNSSNQKQELVSQKILRSLSPVHPNSLCASWTGNTMSSSIARNPVSTLGEKLKISMAHNNEVELLEDTEQSYILKNVKSGKKLPVLLVTVLDGFGVGPTPTIPYNFEARMSSSDEFLQGLYVANVIAGLGNFSSLVGFAKQGNYTLEVVSKDAPIEPVTISVQVRGCHIGEELTSDQLLCQICDSASYNFDPSEEGKCKTCPDGASCKDRYILPTNGYWHNGPCHSHMQKCLNDDACHQGDRQEGLKNFTDELTDCKLNGTTLEEYRQKQCKEGYEGPLCGSCKSSYGLSFGFRCTSCSSRALSILALVGLTFYLLGVSCFTIRGGLPSRSSKGSNNTPAQPVLRTGSADSSCVITINAVATTTTVQNHSLPPSQPMQVPNTFLQQQVDKVEMSRWMTTEIFKILINFVQTTAIAASVDIQWTKGVLKLFEISEYVGALTSLPLSGVMDCMITSTHASERALWRITLSLLIPTAVVGIFACFWGLSAVHKESRFEYFGKRMILSIVSVMYITYLDLTKLAVRSFYCIKIYDSDDPMSVLQNKYWAVDTAMKCFKGDHSTMLVVGIIVLIFVSLGFPLTVFIVLTHSSHQEGQRSSWISDTIGFLYRTFKKQCQFWESLVMSRKALFSIIVVFAYPLGGQSQGLLALLVLLLFLYIHVTIRPYRKEFGLLNHLETASLLIACLTFTAGQFFSLHKCSASTTMVIASCIISTNIIFCVILFIVFFMSGVIHIRLLLTSNNVHVPLQASPFTVLKIYIYSKCSRCFSDTQ